MEYEEEEDQPEFIDYNRAGTWRLGIGERPWCSVSAVSEPRPRNTSDTDYMCMRCAMPVTRMTRD